MSVNVQLQEDNETLFKDFQSNYLQEDIICREEDDEVVCEPKTFNSIANEDDLLQMYLKDIGKVKLLTSKEEKILGKQIKEGKRFSNSIGLVTENLLRRKLQKENLFRQI